jgi:4-amino-4-deoxy-L-arabinose transferase-like glycosyltransferase
MQQKNLTDRPLFPLYLFLVVLAAYIWAAPLRDLYGIEARNGLFVKTMVTEGPSLIPSIMGAPYLDYPPLYFWISWLFSQPAGEVSTLSAVLPSALAAAAMVGLTFLLAKNIGPRTALISALLLATCPDYWLRGSRATIDMLLALWVSLAVFFLYHRYRNASRAGLVSGLAAPVMMGVAFLTKGPVGLVLPVGIWGTFLLVEKKWRPLAVFAAKSLLLAAFCTGVELLFLWRTGGTELIAEVFTTQLGHRLADKANEPAYYYILYLGQGAAPWWLPACGSFFGARKGGLAGERLRAFVADFFSHETLRLAGCWFFFVLVLFTAASTRHSRYLLPLFPALFLLIGRGAELFLEQRGPRFQQSVTAFFRFFFFLLLAASTVMYAAAPLSYRPPAPYWLAWAAFSLLLFVLAVRKTANDFRPLGLALLCVAAAMTAEALLVEPWLSRQESGRRFVETTEATIEKDLPVVLYRINPDGDGVKYALFSSRRSEELFFVDNAARMENITRPFLLVASEKSAHEVINPGSRLSMREISRGLLHKEMIISWLVQDNRQGGSPLPGGAE